MMSNKPHLRPHKKARHASRITRIFVAILILGFFALVIALEVTGHVIFRGRLFLLRGAAEPAPSRPGGQWGDEPKAHLLPDQQHRRGPLTC
jgi:hypothetical protein